MNIKKIFIKSLRIINRSRMQAVRDGQYAVRTAAVSLGTFFSDNNYKKLKKTDGRTPLYDYAREYFAFGGKPDKVEFEKSLVALGEAVDLSGDEIAAVREIFMLAALSSLASICEKSDNGNSESEASAARLISSLRFLSAYENDGLYELLSKSEKILTCDRFYPLLDAETKNIYRRRLTLLAEKNGTTEAETANELLKKARSSVGKRSHIGAYLFETKKNRAYIPLTVLCPIILSVLIGIITKNLLVAFFLLLPIWELVKVIIDKTAGAAYKAEYVPRLRKSGKKTLVTIVTFLSSPDDVDKYSDKIREIYYANKSEDDSFLFGFLADLPEHSEQTSPEDAAVISRVGETIAGLNRELGKHFFAAVRARTYNAETGRYGGNERKRGAVRDFLAYIKNSDDRKFSLVVGNVTDADYFVSLDSDTRPDPGSVEKLINALSHPLSTPVINGEGTAVCDGYAVAVPRIDITLKSARVNPFTKIISGFGGTEVYENVSFGLYSDLFGEGIFSGKGAIDIHAFNKIMMGIFPDNRVLSHDILEGCFLRTAYVSDAVFCDSVPKNAVSYAKRSHRWIRGDWQNIPWMMKDIKTKSGITIKNPLNAVSKYKLFDNLRRSLFPVSVVFLLLYALAVNSIFLAVVAFISVFAAPLIGLFDGLMTIGESRYVRHKSARAVSGTEGFLFALMNFICLPYFAYTAADAAVRALFRRFVTKKKLLEWTTADASDKKLRGTLRETLFAMLPQLIGVLFFLRPLFIPVGVLWLAAPFVMFLLSKPKRTETAPEHSDFYMQCMCDIWRYFDAYLNEHNNYLPPDNFQEAPVKLCAERTSPTNIGLALLCVVGARDMGFIGEDRMLFLLENMLASLEKLEKSHGHFLNWYETTTLKPLRPRFISTVDNGNLAVCLLTLKNALAEIENKRAHTLVTRTEKLITEPDFTFLYNKKRNLFHIGFDVESGKPSDSYYDLYASEARLTSYFCVARGVVPIKHWASLSRFYTVKNGFLGVKSWSGTMFEYFMPHIFLPVSECSLDEEMLRFALDCQKTAVPPGIPWGVSESAYYAFDRELNYQYKAFGVRALAVSEIRGGRTDSVVSPYSSFLTLPVAGGDAVKRNLARFDTLGAHGEFGYYDAVDCLSFDEPTRAPAVVMNSMAHHLGMSFLSCENYLQQNIVVKRFMNAEMNAFSALLEKKPPSGTVRYGDGEHDEKNVKRDRYVPRAEDCTPISTDGPVVRAVSGGSLSDVMTDSGNGFLSYEGVCVTKKRDMTVAPKGIFALVKTNEAIVPFTFAPIYDRSIRYKTWFEDGCAVYYAKAKSIETKQSVTVDPLCACEIREYSIKNNAQNPAECELLLYLEPALADGRSERAHPAFSALFIEASYDKAQKTLFFRRRPRDGADGNGEMWLAIAATEEFVFELSRFNVLKRGEAERSLNEAFSVDFSCETRGPVDPCAALKFNLTVGGAGKNANIRTLCVYFAIGRTRSEAALSLARGRDRTFDAVVEKNAASMLRFYASAVAGKEDVRLSELILSRIFSKRRRDGTVPGGSEEALWKYGVSGDFPVILVKTDEETVSECRSFIKAFLILKKHEIDCELVFCFSEGGSYERRIWSSLKTSFRHLGAEELIDRRNGSFLANIVDISDFNAFRSVAAFYIDLSQSNALTPRRPSFPVPSPLKAEPVDIAYKYKMGLGGFIDGGYAISEKNMFPKRPVWSHVLANETFGTVVSESDAGFTFAINAGLNKLTPWSGDAIAGSRGERLTLHVAGRAYDLLSGATAVFYNDCAEYRSMVGGILINVRIFVPKRISAKIFSVTVANGNDNAQVSLAVFPVMDNGDGKGRIFTEREPGAVYFYNPFNSMFPESRAVLAGEKAGDGKVSFTVEAGKMKTSSFVFGYGKNKKEASLLVSELTESRIESEYENYKNTENRIIIQTPSKELDFFYNTFLLHQALHSRIYARTGFYQCGGAFGFRDQLQDCLCLSTLNPELLKKQILRAASVQFYEGDVLHWWHELPSGVKGARSRSSDDLLWLPLSLVEYVEKTGDFALPNVKTEYLTGRKLSEGENEAYIEAHGSGTFDTVYGHCVKALHRASTVGAHGLALFGSGDWNDGMNALYGGESSFTTLLLIIVLERFAFLSDNRNDAETFAFCLEKATAYRKAFSEHCFENDRFLRGFFPDGSPLGSKTNGECAIDLLPQSFAAIAGGFGEKTTIALKTAEKMLVDSENKLIKLFTPPFDNGGEKPGYIKGYVPGVRENGGQYTHAAVWFALAHFAADDGDRAAALLEMLNPINHTKTLDEVKKYRGEPYVIAADVYANSAHPGMAGWTHYTGAAGWYFKVVTENLLGIVRKNGAITIASSLPSGWSGYSAELTVDGVKIALSVENGGKKLYVDGVLSDSIPLDGKSHSAEYK